MAEVLGKALRVLLVVALAAHVFFMYIFARDYMESFGFSFVAMMSCSGFCAAMLLPTVWVWVLPEIPWEFSVWWRLRRKRLRGQCFECGYPQPTESTEASICPECGTMQGAAPRPLVLVEFIRRSLALSMVGWVAGCVLAENWIQFDERQFAGKAAQEQFMNNRHFGRDARWPSSARLDWTEATGMHRTVE